MKINEVKTAVEQIVRVEYIAEDGMIFHNEEECKKYEDSALFAASAQLKRLHTKPLNQSMINDNFCDVSQLEIFDIQTADDLECLKRYIHLKMIHNRATQFDVDSSFGRCDGRYSQTTLDNLTYGHEVMIFWSYDEDLCWCYRNGSFEDYLSYHRDRLNGLIAPEEPKEG